MTRIVKVLVIVILLSILAGCSVGSDMVVESGDSIVSAATDRPPESISENDYPKTDKTEGEGNQEDPGWEEIVSTLFFDCKDVELSKIYQAKHALPYLYERDIPSPDGTKNIHLVVSKNPDEPGASSENLHMEICYNGKVVLNDYDWRHADEKNVVWLNNEKVLLRGANVLDANTGTVEKIDFSWIGKHQGDLMVKDLAGASGYSNIPDGADKERLDSYDLICIMSFIVSPDRKNVAYIVYNGIANGPTRNRPFLEAPGMDLIYIYNVATKTFECVYEEEAVAYGASIFPEIWSNNNTIIFGKLTMEARDKRTQNERDSIELNLDTRTLSNLSEQLGYEILSETENYRIFEVYDKEKWILVYENTARGQIIMDEGSPFGFYPPPYGLLDDESMICYWKFSDEDPILFIYNLDNMTVHAIHYLQDVRDFGIDNSHLQTVVTNYTQDSITLTTFAWLEGEDRSVVAEYSLN